MIVPTTYPPSCESSRWRAPRATPVWFTVGLLLCLALLNGCATKSFTGFPAPTATSPVWPPPPDAARVVHLASITRHQDLYEIAGFWRSVARVFGGPEDTRLGRPYGLALLPDGAGLIVTDPGRGVAHVFDWERSSYRALGGELPGGLVSPVGVAVLPNGEFLVSDSSRGTVEKFSEKGEALDPFLRAGAAGRPTGIAVDAVNSRVYVADAINHQIAVFDLAGSPIQTFGERGEGQGQFNFPTHLALNDIGELAVTDAMNFRAQVFDAEGAFAREVGMLGATPGRFARPKGLDFDAEGRLFILEGLYDTLQVFDPEGALLLSLGEPGPDHGQFWLSSDVAIDRARGLVFVADGFNARVQIFQILDEPISANDDHNDRVKESAP